MTAAAGAQQVMAAIEQLKKKQRTTKIASKFIIFIEISSKIDLKAGKSQQIKFSSTNNLLALGMQKLSLETEFNLKRWRKESMRRIRRLAGW